MTWGIVSLLISRTETPGEKLALGDSREPPAFTFLSRTRVGKMSPAVEICAKAAPLQALLVPLSPS